MKVIPTWLHGITDYLVGLALLLAPNIFGFADVGGAAVFIPRLLGVLILGQSLLTNYELGVLKVLPMKTHLTMDYVLALFLAASPWIFQFNDQPANVWMPHVVVGIAYFLVSLMTETVPHHRGVREAVHS